MAKLLLESDGRASFFCPGCDTTHHLRVSGEGAWEWNGSLESPTLAPSVLARSGHYAPHRVNKDKCWCTWAKEHPDEPAPYHCFNCHSFVRDGKIMFLVDSSHALAGQTVPLPERE